ncbi:hypothetical protein PG984_011655 [Apiospora sp. TS-2023a]
MEKKATEPLNEKEMFMMALLEKLHPGFRLTDWEEIAAQQNISGPTAKIRFGAAKKQYEKQVEEEAEAAPTASVPSTSGPSASGHSTSGPSASVPSGTGPATTGPSTRATHSTRQALQATQSGSKRPANEDEDHGSGAMSAPPPPKQVRRSARNAEKGQAISGTGRSSEDGGNGDNEGDPVPPHHRFPDPKPDEKAEEDHYEATRLKYGIHRGWAVPRDETFRDWYVPDGLKVKDGDSVPSGDPFAKKPKDKNDRTPLLTLEEKRHRDVIRTRLRRQLEQEREKLMSEHETSTMRQGSQHGRHTQANPQPRQVGHSAPAVGRLSKGSVWPEFHKNPKLQKALRGEDATRREGGVPPKDDEQPGEDEAGEDE